MATWKSSNSMLTQTGIEILNKVKAGIGNMTITRISAGSGRVTPSALFTQTSLSGTQKSMVISDRTTHDTGSEIVVYITNVGYTSPFELNQIGIYVTHPDYSGEQLYHISQCDADDFDTIPTFDETPVNFGYNIFLEHGNSDSISININTEGMLSLATFYKFKESIVSGNLVESDSERNLKDTGKKISEISGKNLIHNWDFSNPVNRKNGYAVPPNTPYFSNTGLTSQAGTLSAYTTFKPVDNTNYGTVTVGSSTYYVSQNYAVKGYVEAWGTAFDRWLCGGDGIVLLEDDGIIIQGAFDQFVSSIPEEGVYTASVLMNDGTLLTATSTYSESEPFWTTTSMFYINMDFSTGYEGHPRFRLYPIPSELGSRKVLAVKLEKGKVSTLMQDFPADHSEQVAICRQYDPFSHDYVGFNYAPKTSYYINDTGEISIFFKNSDYCSSIISCRGVSEKAHATFLFNGFGKGGATTSQVKRLSGSDKILYGIIPETEVGACGVTIQNNTGTRLYIDVTMLQGNSPIVSYVGVGATILPYEWENPPLEVDVEYRTTERYKGQAVYVKLSSDGVIHKYLADGTIITNTQSGILNASLEEV